MKKKLPIVIAVILSVLVVGAVFFHSVSAKSENDASEQTKCENPVPVAEHHPDVAPTGNDRRQIPAKRLLSRNKAAQRPTTSVDARSSQTKHIEECERERLRKELELLREEICRGIDSGHNPGQGVVGDANTARARTSNWNLNVRTAPSSVSMFNADDGIVVSVTPTAKIADPVNPRPGMVFKGYNVDLGRQIMRSDTKRMQELPTILNKTATVKTTTVQNEKFSYGQFKDVTMTVGVWEGFLQCKRSANCTILIQQDTPTYEHSGYLLFINGRMVVCGYGQESATVDLKGGFNYVKFIGINAGKFPASISLKATDSLKEPKPLTPKDMFYDEKPDDCVLF